jgi:hypothetical protein
LTSPTVHRVLGNRWAGYGLIATGLAVTVAARAARREWFVPKTFGLGLRPSTWEAWAIFAATLICIFVGGAIIQSTRPARS